MTETSRFARLDPPYAADEVTMLRSFLDYYRVTIKRQAEGLTREQLATPLPPAASICSPACAASGCEVATTLAASRGLRGQG